MFLVRTNGEQLVKIQVIQPALQHRQESRLVTGKE